MLYIHIGFHKTGTSTIQHFLSGNGDLLARHGVIYPRAGRRATAHFNLTAELMGKVSYAERKGSWTDLLAEMAAKPGTDFIISSEGFHTLNPEQIKSVRDRLAGVDVTICAYVRDLCESLVSRYSQKVKSGSWTGTFDEFFERLYASRGEEDAYNSMYAQLERWANVFGWAAMRVRSLDPRDLTGGELLTDVLSIVGLHTEEVLSQTSVESISARNISPGWKELELVRDFHRFSGGLRADRSLRREGRFKTIREVASRIRRAGSAAAEDVGLGRERAQYLSPEQWRASRKAYLTNIRKLNQRTEHQIPEPSTLEPSDRPFLPSADAVAMEERVRFNERMMIELLPYLDFGKASVGEDACPGKGKRKKAGLATTSQERTAAAELRRALRREKRAQLAKGLALQPATAVSVAVSTVALH